MCKLQKRLELKEIEGQEMIAQIQTQTQSVFSEIKDDSVKEWQRKVRDQMLEIQTLSDQLDHSKQLEVGLQRQVSKMQQET